MRNRYNKIEKNRDKERINPKQETGKQAPNKRQEEKTWQEIQK